MAVQSYVEVYSNSSFYAPLKQIVDFNDKKQTITVEEVSVVDNVLDFGDVAKTTTKTVTKNLVIYFEPKDWTKFKTDLINADFSNANLVVGGTGLMITNQSSTVVHIVNSVVVENGELVSIVEKAPVPNHIDNELTLQVDLQGLYKIDTNKNTLWFEVLRKVPVELSLGNGKTITTNNYKEISVAIEMETKAELDSLLNDIDAHKNDDTAYFYCEDLTITKGGSSRIYAKNIVASSEGSKLAVLYTSQTT